MYVGGVVLLRNFPFVGEVRLTVLTRFRERAIRSYRTIDRVGVVVIVYLSKYKCKCSTGSRFDYLVLVLGPARPVLCLEAGGFINTVNTHLHASCICCCFLAIGGLGI